MRIADHEHAHAAAGLVERARLARRRVHQRPPVRRRLDEQQAERGLLAVVLADHVADHLDHRAGVRVGQRERDARADRKPRGGVEAHADVGDIARAAHRRPRHRAAARPLRRARSDTLEPVGTPRDIVHAARPQRGDRPGQLTRPRVQAKVRAMRLLVFAVLVVPRLVLADVPDDGASPTDAPANATARHEVPVRHKDIVVTTPGERTAKNIAIIGGHRRRGRAARRRRRLLQPRLAVGGERRLGASQPVGAVDQRSPGDVRPRARLGRQGRHLLRRRRRAARRRGGRAHRHRSQRTRRRSSIPHIEVGPGGATLGGTWSF